MIFTQLILAHLFGDFIFQPNSWVADKEKKKIKSKYLYFHVLIHFVLTMLFLWNLKYWWIAVIVAVSHFFIDLAKLEFQTPKTKRLWFFADQLLHILVLVALSISITPYFDIRNYLTNEVLRFIAGLVFVTIPASVIVKILIASWTPESFENTTPENESLQNAGKYIGILERTLVFIFIYVDHWEGVGFMIAAKSVFRFSDLAQARQRKLTEYVLIGTLLSFGTAILTAVLTKL